MGEDAAYRRYGGAFIILLIYRMIMAPPRLIDVPAPARPPPGPI